jgi:hypothetical protein
VQSQQLQQHNPHRKARHAASGSFPLIWLVGHPRPKSPARGSSAASQAGVVSALGTTAGFGRWGCFWSPPPATPTHPHQPRPRRLSKTLVDSSARACPPTADRTRYVRFTSCSLPSLPFSLTNSILTTISTCRFAAAAAAARVFFFFVCVLTNSHDDHCSMRMQAPVRLRKWNELTSPVRFGDSSVRRSPCQDKQRERERERARASGGREGKGRDGTREGTSQRWRAVRFPAVRCSFDGRHLPNGRLPAVPHTATAGLLHAHARLSSAAAPTPPAAPQSSSFLLRFASVPFPSPPLPTSPASSGLAVAAPTAEPALAPAAIRINSSVQIRLD